MLSDQMLMDLERESDLDWMGLGSMDLAMKLDLVMPMGPAWRKDLVMDLGFELQQSDLEQPRLDPVLMNLDLANFWSFQLLQFRS